MKLIEASKNFFVSNNNELKEYTIIEQVLDLRTDTLTIRATHNGQEETLVFTDDTNNVFRYKEDFESCKCIPALTFSCAKYNGVYHTVYGDENGLYFMPFCMTDNGIQQVRVGVDVISADKNTSVKIEAVEEKYSRTRLYRNADHCMAFEKYDVIQQDGFKYTKGGYMQDLSLNAEQRKLAQQIRGLFDKAKSIGMQAIISDYGLFLLGSSDEYYISNGDNSDYETCVGVLYNDSSVLEGIDVQFLCEPHVYSN